MMKYVYRVGFTGALTILSLLLGAQGSFQAALKVGDKAPMLDAFKWIQAPITNFKKGKMYLVDFGATWCVPCAKAIPYLSRIASEFKEDLEVIGVFVMEIQKTARDTSYISLVEQYVKKKGPGLQYTVAIDQPDDRIANGWLKAAGLNGIPQVFIIDKDGYIAWIGNPEEAMLRQVINLVRSEDYSLTDAIAGSQMFANDQKPLLDQTKLLFTQGNGKDDDFLFRSILSRYKGERAMGNYDYIHSWPLISTPCGDKLPGTQQVAVTLGELYFLAYADTLTKRIYTRQPHLDGQYPDTVAQPWMRSWYGRYWYRPLLEVKDRTPFEFSRDSPNNKYIYSLVSGDKQVKAPKLQQIMRSDLKNTFGYLATVEERMMPCWNLVATTEAKHRLQAKQDSGKFTEQVIDDTLARYPRAIMKDIWIRLVFAFSKTNSSYEVDPIDAAPFIDATGIIGTIAYDITKTEVEAFQNANWEGVKAFLNRFGLKLEKGKKKMKVIVIRDPN